MDVQHSLSSGFASPLHSSSLFLKGGVLPAMMTSLAFPERRDLRVDLYPRVTAKAEESVLLLPDWMRAKQTFAGFHDQRQTAVNAIRGLLRLFGCGCHLCLRSGTNEIDCGILDGCGLYRVLNEARAWEIYCVADFSDMR